MNIKELKKAIKDLPDKMEVILQKDGEGNGYSPLVDIDSNVVYIPDSTWSGELWPMEWSADDADMEEEEWEEIKKKPRSVVLCPVN